jgi:hypothetical protein
MWGRRISEREKKTKVHTGIRGTLNDRREYPKMDDRNQTKQKSTAANQALTIYHVFTTAPIPSGSLKLRYVARG